MPIEGHSLKEYEEDVALLKKMTEISNAKMQLSVTINSVIDAIAKLNILTQRQKSGYLRALRASKNPADVLAVIKVMETAVNSSPHAVPTFVHRIDNLAKDFQDYKLAQLKQDRSIKGFEHFIVDLKGEMVDGKLQAYNLDQQVGTRNDGTIRKWTLMTTPNGSLLNVLPNATRQDYDEIHRFLNAQFNDKKWWKKLDDAGIAQYNDNAIGDPKMRSPADFNLPLKTLGGYGQNLAVDPIILVIGEDGKLKVLGGEKGPNKEAAFPGGMQEASVLNTCINELLEEIYGGSLFKTYEDGKDCPMFAMVDKQDAVQLDADLFKKFNTADGFDNAELGSLLAIKKAFDASKVGQNGKFLEILSSSKSNSEKIKELDKLIKDVFPKVDDQHHYSMEMRRILFRKLLPNEYNKFKSLIAERVKAGPKEPNRADPRNTDFAHMVTTPLVGTFTQEEMNDIAKQCGLEMVPGDDLGKNQFYPVEKFSNAYSDHCYFLLKAIKQQILDGKLPLTPTINEQINQLEKGLQKQLSLMAEQKEKQDKTAKMFKEAGIQNDLRILSGSESVLISNGDKYTLKITCHVGSQAEKDPFKNYNKIMDVVSGSGFDAKGKDLVQLDNTIVLNNLTLAQVQKIGVQAKLQVDALKANQDKQLEKAKAPVKPPKPAEYQTTAFAKKRVEQQNTDIAQLATAVKSINGVTSCSISSDRNNEGKQPVSIVIEKGKGNDPTIQEVVQRLKDMGVNIQFNPKKDTEIKVDLNREQLIMLSVVVRDIKMSKENLMVEPKSEKGNKYSHSNVLHQFKEGAKEQMKKAQMKLNEAKESVQKFRKK